MSFRMPPWCVSPALKPIVNALVGPEAQDQDPGKHRADTDIEQQAVGLSINGRDDANSDRDGEKEKRGYSCHPPVEDLHAARQPQRSVLAGFLLLAWRMVFHGLPFHTPNQLSKSLFLFLAFHPKPRTDGH